MLRDQLATVQNKLDRHNVQTYQLMNKTKQVEKEVCFLSFVSIFLSSNYKEQEWIVIKYAKTEFRNTIYIFGV